MSVRHSEKQVPDAAGVPSASTAMKDRRAARRDAPLWVRILVRVAEVVVWALTLGLVKRVTALERLLGYSPRWSEANAAGDSIRDVFRSGVGAARRLAQPLRIETDFSTDVAADNAPVLTPRTATVYEETLKTRLRVNARIRSSLREVPLEELEAPFIVNACTWNVDQQPPPLHDEAFMSWLLGQELTDEIKHYQQHKQTVVAHGGAVPHPRVMSPASTMRVRKASSATGASTSSFTTSKHASSDLSASEVIGPLDPLESEWQWLESKFPDLLLISLQEVEMTGTALVKESTQRRWEWTEAILETLLAASDRSIKYKKLQVVQLVGLVLIVLVQAKHVDYVSHVRLSLTRTGALSVLGNKGSVAMRATIYGKRFLFISAHFAAHTYNEKRRTGNYQAALTDIRFEMPAWSDDESEVLQTYVNAVQSSGHKVKNMSIAESNSSWDRLFCFGNTAFRPTFSAAAETRVLDDHDYVFFLGDLNSRLHALPGAEIRQSVAQGEYDYLLCHDELRQLMVAGEAFDGFQEQWISFPPTYKYDRNTDVYDTSRKHRDPAWCDRVLFRVLESDTNPLSQSEGAAEVVEGVTAAVGQRSPSPPGPATSRSRRASSSSASLPSRPSVSGEWVSLEELQRKALTRDGAEAVEDDASSTSSSAPPTEKDKSTSAVARERVKTAAAAAAVAAQNGYASTSLLRRVDPTVVPPSLSQSSSHAVWEHKPTAPTFCAARRPRGVEPSADPFSVRFPMVTNHVHPLEYTHVATLRESDHRPVRARFEVKVVALDASTVKDVIESVQEVIG